MEYVLIVDFSMSTCKKWSAAHYDVVSCKVDQPRRLTFVYTTNPFVARDLMHWFDGGHDAIAHLVDIVLGDAWMLRDEARMDLFIARLSKLLKVLRGTCIWVYDGEYEVCIKAYELYIAEVVERHIRTMKVFARRAGRVRRMVHELLYPRLRDDLERMQHAIVYAPVTSGAPLVCEYRYDAEAGVTMRSCYVHSVRMLGDGMEWFNVPIRDPFCVIRTVIRRRRWREEGHVVDLEPIKLVLENA